MKSNWIGSEKRNTQRCTYVENDRLRGVNSFQYLLLYQNKQI